MKQSAAVTHVLSKVGNVGLCPEHITGSVASLPPPDPPEPEALLPQPARTSAHAAAKKTLVLVRVMHPSRSKEHAARKCAYPLSNPGRSRAGAPVPRQESE